MRYLSKLSLLLACTISGTMLCSSPAAANDVLDRLLELSFEELYSYEISVASKRMERVSDAPGIVNVITAEDIKRYGGNNLYDVIRRLPNIEVLTGLLLNPRNFDLNVRGQMPPGGASHLLILLNGRPMREGDGGRYHAVYNSFPLETIARIEVIRGPGSVLYGSDAFASVVNIVTKKAKSDTPERSVSYGYGSFNTKQGELTYRQQFENGSFSGGVKSFDSDGWENGFVGVDGNFGSEKMFHSAYGAVFNAEYKNLTINGFSGLQTQPAVPFVSKFPFGGENKSRNDFIDFGYKYDINKNWQASFNLTYNGYETFITFASPREHNTMLYEAAIAGSPIDKVNVVAGLVHEKRRGSLKAIGGMTRRYINSGYLQVDYTPIDDLKLIAGLQINKPEGLDYDPSPRFGAIYHFTSELGMKLLHAKAFRVANAVETQIDIGIIKGEPDLESETIVTTDLQLFHQTPKSYSAITYYTSRVNDAVVILPFDDDGIQRFGTGGDQKFEGLELESKYLISNELEINGSLTYQRGKEISSGNKEIVNNPHFMFKLGASYASPDGYNIGLFNSYFSDVPNNNKPGTMVVNPASGDYDVLTANFSVDANKVFNIKKFPQTEFSLYVDNVLDQDIYVNEPDGIINTVPSRPGRAFYGSVNMKF